jgi:drug/metabolite transporter (DMT)-like permease
MAEHEKGKLKILMALAAVYLSWGSTYLAIRIALTELPPFFMMGIRFFLVGIGLYMYLRIRGSAAPTRRQWLNATAIGGFLFLGGSAGVAYAQQWVASGLAALVIGTTPLWTVLFACFWGHRPARLEWVGLLLGFAGILLLNSDGDLRTHPAGAAALLLAAASWAFGSAWSLRLSFPPGMMAGATQMICGGAVVLLVGFGIGERIVTVPTWHSLGAVLYLAVVGSLVGFTAFIYLLKRVRPALATSYAYVNPVLAVALGVWLAGEKITGTGITAMVVIVVGVVLLAIGQRHGST